MRKKKTFLDNLIHYGRDNLSEESKASEYLYSRNVSEDQIEEFNIGYIPPKHDFSVKGDSFDGERFVNWSKDGKYLEDKLLFPVEDPLGNVVGIHIRTPDSEKKDYMKFYLNSSKASARFFGIGSAMPTIWKSGEIHLCEGLFDLFPLKDLFPNTVCTLTAKITNQQLSFLERFVSEIYIAFDQDEQGNRFFRKFKRKHKEDFFRIKKLEFKGEDISKCREMMDKSRFEELICKQKPSI